jgi:hypothetical protein
MLEGLMTQRRVIFFYHLLIITFGAVFWILVSLSFLD